MALNLDAAGRTIGPLTKEYTQKDVILYALGVGAGSEELDLVYEKELKVLPSFAVPAVFDFLSEVALQSNINLAGMLHGEQDLVFHRPLHSQGILQTTGRITDFFDLGADKGALIRAEGVTGDAEGKKLFTNRVTIFARLDGGFGGRRPPRQEVVIPDRATAGWF